MAQSRSNWEKELASIDKTLLDLLNRRASLFQAHSGDPGVSKRLGKSQDLIEHRAGPGFATKPTACKGGERM